MANVIRCRELGFDCDGVIRADTEEEALEQAAEHAREEHGLDEISPETAEKLKSVMSEE